MKRFSLLICCVMLMALVGLAWGQAPLCPQGKTIFVPMVGGSVIPVVPKPDHCVAEPTDSDSDGMADSWELAWFGNLTAANGLGMMTDYDEDGISDLEEYEKGGNPTVNDASAILTANHCQQRYLPFGDEFNSDECGQIKHAGRVHDKRTELHYNRARYYDASIGQFLSPDPVRAVDHYTGEINLEVLQNPQRLNSYAYALNNPYRYADPLGEFADDPDSGSPVNLLMPGIDNAGAFTDGMIIAENIDFIDKHFDPTSFSPLSIVNKGAKAAKSAKELTDNISKIVNSNMGHAEERAVERAGFKTIKEAREALKEFSQDIEKRGLPPNTVQDTIRSDRVIVPGFGEGGAVVYQVRDGVYKLKTVLQARPQ